MTPLISQTQWEPYGHGNAWGKKPPVVPEPAHAGILLLIIAITLTLTLRKRK